MCESMCVGSLRMTFVPVEAPKVVPKQRIRLRQAHEFRLGDRIMCVVDSMEVCETTVYVVTERGTERLLFCTNGPCVNLTLSPYHDTFVLESETTIENGVRVVGYVNDPCGPATVTPPKTLKFNDLPNWCVFRVDDRSGMGWTAMQFLKISYNVVVRWDDGSIESSRKHGGSPAAVFTNGSSYARGLRVDQSWGIYDNLADCTIIGNIKFG